ncbi:hypothetical protein [Flavobacterium sp.]
MDELIAQFEMNLKAHLERTFAASAEQDLFCYFPIQKLTVQYLLGA